MAHLDKIIVEKAAENIVHGDVPLFLDGDFNDTYNTYFMGVIYKITNLSNGKIYVGKTINKYTAYIKSKLRGIKRNPNKHLAYAVEKYGISNFSVKVIDVARTVKDLDALEIEHIKKEMSTDPNIGYNISLGGTGGPNFKGHKHTEASKIKMSQSSRHYSANKGKKLTEEWKENIRLGLRGVVHNAKWNQNIGKGLKGLTKSAEHRKNLSLANKGKKLTEETRQKLREKHKTRIYCDKKIIDLSNVVVNSLQELDELAKTTYACSIELLRKRFRQEYPSLFKDLVFKSRSESHRGLTWTWKRKKES